MSHYGIRYQFEKRFHEKNEDFKFLYPALTELVKSSVVEEYDIIHEGGVESALFIHPDHGDMQYTDFELVDGVDEVLHLGPGAIKFALEHASQLTDLSVEGGFDKALKTLTSLPIDSTAWTGLPKGFVFTERTKEQLIKLLDEAANALSSSNLTNFQIGQGVAYLRAAKILADAPEPPKNEIWALLQKGSAIASLASFFAPIFGIFKS